MFVTRLISGIVLVIIAAASIVLGGNVMFGVVAAISFIGLFEIYRVFKLEKTILAILGYLFTAAYYALLYVGGKVYVPELLIGLLICLMTVYVFDYPKYRTEDIMAGLCGMVYVVFMLSYLYQIRCLPNGAYLTGLVFFCAWGCDTCAYVFGMLCGKHKMAPVLSPKKSVEGGIGGIFGAAVLGAAYGAVGAHYGLVVSEHNVALIFAVCCAVGAVISQIGDLSASAIKRNHDIKDYGNLIPGHGGILDRFDSIIITAPIIFTLASWMM